MNVTKPSLAASLLVLVVATPASPQAAARNIPPAFWKPVVGSGAAYVMDEMLDSRTPLKMEMTITVTGTEAVAGKTGYWVEMANRDARFGTGRTRLLYVGDRTHLDIKKMLFQVGNGPLTEMPTGDTDEKESATTHDLELLGTEPITTPAGTFVCQHYRTKATKAASGEEEPPPSGEEGDEAQPPAGPAPRAGGDSEDYWLSDKVTPFGMVKTVSKSGTMTLVRLITNAAPGR